MNKESLVLRFLYNTIIGRFILKIISNRFISYLVGVFLSCRLSKFLIKPFVKKNNICLNDYYSNNFKSFNDCFSRKIHEQLRPIDMKNDSLISPSDGCMSAYHIQDGLVLPVKQSYFTIESLLKDKKLKEEYNDGICLVIRLCVDNYHRYCYLDSGKKEKNVYIPGKLHTVRPIALEKLSVYTENSREYTIMHTDNFKDVIQIEVGALLVGKIDNYHEKYSFKKGEEKGKFLFGGSTIILLFKKNAVEVYEKYFIAGKKNEEIPVKMGERIGASI